MEWGLKKFNELTLDELYSILQLRNKVFIVEQACIYNDTDDKDQSAWHLLGTDEDKLIAYARILPPGLVYDEPAIGRVVTSPLRRGTGLGRELMNRSFDHCERLFGKTAITLSAQVYLKDFYESLDFFSIGQEYLDDGIPHIQMIRKASRRNPA